MSNPSGISGRLLRVKEVAIILNIDRRTLWLWLKKGMIKGVILPSGQYRIPESEVTSILSNTNSKEASQSKVVNNLSVALRI
jgi:excisionase family DNA binding protein